MLSLASIWRTRYSDMLFPRSSPLQSRKTLLAWLEKNIAAWPAELAPPTMYTSSSLHEKASVWAAP